MQQSTMVVFGAVLASVALFGAIATTTMTVIVPVDAQEGVPFAKNFGQCKQDKNRNACENNK